jgi:enoyl-CoA hydratase/carnithine racemase/3-hydroxyacyl-CoA dehydrogenase
MDIMIKSMRQSTIETLGLGSVLDIFRNGRLPADPGALVDEVFGEAGNRGSLVVSGANGIVGAGKTMQLGSRLEPYGVRVVGLDFPNAPDGIGKQYPGLVRAFGPDGANRIMGNIIRLTYDGKNLPPELVGLRPRYLLEAIPEILNIKKAHYELFRSAVPGIEIRSVTSGFPSAELGVGIAHPAFPHEINKVWEVVEEKPSAITKLKWALGLMPIPVGDQWSFVLDVLFCGLTLAGTRFHHATNMPFWKIDKYVRQLVGPNPFRAHDAIGAVGANFLTWSCLHHLSGMYGAVFEPTPTLEEHKVSGNWYPQNHFRPLVDWKLEGDDEREDFHAWILGSLIQMTSLMLHENRAHLSHMNSIGELCAQFRKGILAVIRELGADGSINLVHSYHRLHPEASKGAWHPDVFERLEGADWQQLYVNAEHDGQNGVITIGREAYNSDVDREMNRAIDWLKTEGIDHVIVTGDFHLSTQMVGADTSEFFPALKNADDGARIAGTWSKTARRLDDEFKVSVGFVNGKRCLGGMLELMMHCHYLVATDGASLGMPEVTLPVVPGMEGCHWPFRKARSEDWPKLVQMLLGGRSISAKEGAGWLIDYAGPLDEALKVVWKIATEGDSGVARRDLETGALKGVPVGDAGLPPADGPAAEAARKAIADSIQGSCSATLAEALEVQTKHSAGFMTTSWCRKGQVGSEYARTAVE